jgi:hypothetical protein
VLVLDRRKAPGELLLARLWVAQADSRSGEALGSVDQIQDERELLAWRHAAVELELQALGLGRSVVDLGHSGRF